MIFRSGVRKSIVLRYDILTKRYRCVWRKVRRINRFRAFSGPDFFFQTIDANRCFRASAPIRTGRFPFSGRCIQPAPFLKADGLEDGYKVLADFNGTVLAGVQSKHGVHFVTWDWAYGHTGVCHGHYFMENYAGAKQDFAIRSGLIQKERLFTPEQMTEIYRCCADSVDGDFFELTGEQVLTLCIQPRNGSPQIFKPEVLSAASSTGHLTPSQPDSAVSNAFLLRCLAPGFSCDCPRF